MLFPAVSLPPGVSLSGRGSLRRTEEDSRASRGRTICVLASVGSPDCERRSVRACRTQGPLAADRPSFAVRQDARHLENTYHPAPEARESSPCVPQTKVFLLSALPIGGAQGEAAVSSPVRCKEITPRKGYEPAGVRKETAAFLEVDIVTDLGDNVTENHIG